MNFLQTFNRGYQTGEKKTSITGEKKITFYLNIDPCFRFLRFWWEKYLKQTGYRSEGHTFLC